MDAPITFLITAVVGIAVLAAVFGAAVLVGMSNSHDRK
jgi:hypothetical protein